MEDQGHRWGYRMIVEGGQLVPVPVELGAIRETYRSFVGLERRKRFAWLHSRIQIGLIWLSFASVSAVKYNSNYITSLRD